MRVRAFVVRSLRVLKLCLTERTQRSCTHNDGDGGGGGCCVGDLNWVQNDDDPVGAVIELSACEHAQHSLSGSCRRAYARGCSVAALIIGVVDGNRSVWNCTELVRIYGTHTHTHIRTRTPSSHVREVCGTQLTLTHTHSLLLVVD